LVSEHESRLQQVIKAIERILCRLRKLEQLNAVTASVEECAEILGISRGLAYDCVKRGTIPSISLNGRKLIPINSLARMLVEADERVKAKAEPGDDA
jgi:hypothetical protein